MLDKTVGLILSHLKKSASRANSRYPDLSLTSSTNRPQICLALSPESEMGSARESIDPFAGLDLMADVSTPGINAAL